MQKQAIVTVRLVMSDDQTLDDAEAVVTEALENAELMAHVKGEYINIVDEGGNIRATSKSE